MNNLTIREAVPDDALNIIAFLKKVGAETDNLSFGAEGLPVSNEDESAYIKSILEDEKSCLYLALKDGEMIGNSSLNGLPRRMSHRAEVGISVLRSEWDKGVGSQLLQKAIEYARLHDVEIINLEVRSDNARAIHVYEKFGFCKIGTSPAFHKIGNLYVDYDLMYLDLR